MSALQKHRNTVIDALRVALDQYEYLHKMADGNADRRIWFSCMKDAKAALKALQDEESD